jgi:hypothetical protein
MLVGVETTPGRCFVPSICVVGVCWTQGENMYN